MSNPLLGARPRQRRQSRGGSGSRLLPVSTQCSPCGCSGVGASAAAHTLALNCRHHLSCWRRRKLGAQTAWRISRTPAGGVFVLKVTLQSLSREGSVKPRPGSAAGCSSSCQATASVQLPALPAASSPPAAHPPWGSVDKPPCPQAEEPLLTKLQLPPRQGPVCWL